MTKKRSHNPKTKKYYALRQKTIKLGERGQIKSSWPAEAKKLNKRLSPVLKKLSLH